MKIKKNFIFTLLTASLLIACQSSSLSSSSDSLFSSSSQDSSSQVDDMLTEPVYDGDIVVSEVYTDAVYGNTYLKVMGQPFAYLGTQIRTDALMNTDYYDYDDLYILFQEAAELGVTSVQIPIEWADIEIEEDVFDFHYVDQMLRFSVLTNLKIEFLWFGSNMCGDTHSYTVPDYILRDGKTYPKLDAERTGEFWNYYGIMWYLIFNNPALLEREINAVNHLMEYVWQWDRTHGGYHPLIGMQIHNEADIFVRFRTDQYNVQSPLGEKISYEAGWQMVLDAVNQIGLAVKDAKYKVYTRHNFASSTASWQNGTIHGIYQGTSVKTPPIWAQNFFELDGIDIIGDDAYRSSVKDIKGIVTMYGSNLSGNFSHIAENDGNYSNTPSLILTTISQNGGYSIYDLFTSPFFAKNNTSNIDQGIIIKENNQYVKKSHYQETQNIIELIKKAGPSLISSHKDNIAAFNLQGNNPLAILNQTIKTRHVQAQFETANGSLALLVSNNEEIVFGATGIGRFKLSNITYDNIQTGYFNNNGEFIEQNTISLDQNGYIQASSGLIYRIVPTSINSSLTSNTWSAIGEF